MTVRLVALLLVSAFAFAGQLQTAHADGHDTIIDGVTNEGATLGIVSSEKFTAMEAHYWKALAPKPPFYEYGSASVCGGAPGDPDGGNECGRAGMCERLNTTALMGPAVAAWRRQVDATGRPVPGAAWTKIGDTCQPERIPGNTNALTMAMIRAAFHDTEFSVPTVNIQPEGNLTLVSLPTYFEVRFPDTGFGPDDVDTVDPARMLGRTVQVRPRLKSLTYHLGERTIGPTTSLGGPYPDGDVTATYTRPGQHQVRVDITYTGQYRLGTSGPWLTIPGEVTRQGTPTTLDVREARARLYTS